MMALCDQIRLLLGPFEDGELEPHEIDEVAHHVTICGECKAILEHYRTLGLSLRSIAEVPALDGFAEAVQARIAKVRIPLRIRIGRYFDSVSERLMAGAAIGAASAIAAVITIVLVTPVARQIVGGKGSTSVSGASNHAPFSGTIAKLAAKTGLTAHGSSSLSQRLAAREKTRSKSSEAVISSLEADSPSVAVWNEPRSDTTVIWVPDQH
jgi:anti-sigma factor RsiW